MPTSQFHILQAFDLLIASSFKVPDGWVTKYEAELAGL
jgi:hypothetical protein